MPVLEAAEPLRPTEPLTLFIDLDGTLLKTDTLPESMLALLKQKPFYVLLLPLWWLKGRAHLKQQIARHMTLDVACLPYQQELLAYLSEEHRAGRTIVLATGADITIAQQIAKHLGFFSMVMATDGESNLTGLKKLQRLKQHMGEAEFIYAGNSKVDLPIWRSSKNAILVNAPKRLVHRVDRVSEITHVFQYRRHSIWALIKAIRAHHWVKNLLIFVPLITAHQILEPDRLFDVLIAFIAFSLCSSGGYIVNDLLDLQTDRRHPIKKHRPFAAGDLPLQVGVFLPLILYSFAGISGWLLSFQFVVVLGIYVALTMLYSFYLKRVVLADVLLLASLYTLRIIAGGIASQIHLSNWLMLFSLFLFLSLAMLKRFAELQKLHSQKLETNTSRGYLISDIEQLAIMGSASGYITALVLALYISSDDVRVLYERSEILWLSCPLILYWISRAWLMARRGQMEDDPIVFAIKDKTTYAIAILAAIIFILAI